MANAVDGGVTYNVVSGGAGKDKLVGGLGNDWILGGAGEDLIVDLSGRNLFDAGAGSDRVVGGTGDDVFIHRIGENAGSSDRYEGNLGTDTLRLELTAAEWARADVQSDITAFLAHIATAKNKLLAKAGLTSEFSFSSTRLVISNIEKLEVRVGGVIMNLADEAVTARADALTVTEDSSAATVDLLANDSVSDRAASVQLLAPSTLGTVTLVNSLLTGVQTATLSFKPGAAMQALRAGETRTETLSYRVTDVDGDVSVSTIKITVTGVNDAAIIGQPTVALVTEDACVTAGKLVAAGKISVSDVDTSEAGFQTAVVASSGALGSLTLQANGSYSYSVSNAAVQYLGAGQSKVESFTVKSLDGTTQVVSFTIKGVNDAAVIGQPTVATVTENLNVVAGKLTAAGSISISDVDAGQAAFQTTVAPAAGTLGALTLQANGAYVYSVSNAAVQYLAAGQSKVDSFTIKALDGATKVVAFTIKGAGNVAATIGEPTVSFVTEDISVSGGLLKASGTISIVDPDAGQQGFQTVVTPAAGVLGALTLQANGAYVYSVSNAAVQALVSGQNKLESFTIKAIDGTTKVVTFTIMGADDAAVIGEPTVSAVTEDVGVSTDGLLTASGVISIVDPDASQQGFQTVVTPAGGVLGALTLQVNGAYVYSVSNAAVQSLGAGQSKVESFTIKAIDGAAKVVSFTINGANDAPVVSAEGLSVAENESGALVARFIATDVDGGASLTFRVLDGGVVDPRFVVVPAAGGAMGAPGAYEVRLAPGVSFDFEAENADGVPTIIRTIEANDGQTVRNLGQASFVVTVTDVPEGPTARDDTGATFEDVAVNFTTAALVGNDENVPGGGALTIVGVSGALHGTVSFSNGVVTFTPAANFSGIASFDYTVGNGAGTDVGTVTIDVAPVADAPSLSVQGGPLPLTGDRYVSFQYYHGGSAAAAVEDGYVLAFIGEDVRRSYGVYLQRYTSDGEPIGGPTLVNTTVQGTQENASITAIEDGFVVVWMDYSGGPSIAMQRFDLDGASQGVETRVSSPSGGSHSYPAVVQIEGGYVVTWVSLSTGDGSEMSPRDVYAQRFSNDGEALGPLTLVSAEAGARNDGAAIAAIDGGYVIAWSSALPDGGDGLGVFLQRYRADGVAQGGPVTASAPGDLSATQPAVAAIDGGYVVVWQGADGDGSGILAQRYDDAGVPLGSPMRVNGSTVGDQVIPVVASYEGGFIVGWGAPGQDGDTSDVFARRFDASGVAIGSEFQVNSDSIGHQRPNGSIGGGQFVALPDGTLIATWMQGSASEHRLFDLNEAIIEAPEDTPVALSISAALADVDGSESLSVRLTGLPAGSTLSTGTPPASDGSFTVTGAQLASLTFTPPANYSGAFTIAVTAIATETASGETATAVQTIDVTIKPVTDAPILTAAPTAGSEDTAIPLDISAILGDLDGSEMLTAVYIQGLPRGSTISTGALPGRFGSFSIPASELENLTFTPPANFSGVISLYVQVDAIESATGLRARVETWTEITVTPVADAPTLDVSGFEAILPTSGDEQVNDAAAGYQLLPSVATIPGGYVLTWTAAVTSPQFDVMMQRYAADGTKLGGETIVNTTTDGVQAISAVAAVGDGFVVTWTSQAPGSSAADIYMQRYSADGAPLGGETKVSTTPGAANLSDIMTVDGGFVVIWSLDTAETNQSFHLQAYSTDGAPVGGEIVLDNLGNTQTSPSIARIDGGFVVAWTQSNPNQVFAQRFTSEGAPLADAVGLATDVHRDVRPSVASLEDGYVVVWGANYGSDAEAYAQVFGADGAPQGAAFEIGAETSQFANAPSVIGYPGGFVVAWTGYTYGASGNDADVFAQRYSADGAPLGDAFRLNDATAGFQEFRTDSGGYTLAATPQGELIVSWTNAANLGDVFQRRFALSAVASGEEDTAIALPFSAALTDTDGSETLSITLSGLPEGATLSTGTVAASDGSFTLTGAQLTGLTFTPPSDYNGVFTLTITATSTETANGATASTVRTVVVTVTPVDDAPTVALVSATVDGQAGAGSSDDGVLSGDGRFIAFESDVSSLVAGDTNSQTDIFVRDLVTGVIERVSLGVGSAELNDASFDPSISADGRYVSFESYATNAVAGDVNGETDVFMHDRQTGLTTIVSVNSAGDQGNNSSGGAVLSADGRHVAFVSVADNLVAGDTNQRLDVFVRDLDTGVTERVSLSSQGAQANRPCYGADISADGRLVTYYSEASTLTSGDGNAMDDVFLHDRATGMTTRLSAANVSDGYDAVSALPSISADGSAVAFQSSASNLVAGDFNQQQDIFVFDVASGSVARVSRAFDGGEANGYSSNALLSANGRFVAFRSDASNLVEGDDNEVTDLFLYDRTTGSTVRLPTGDAGAGFLNVTSISNDGARVAFATDGRLAPSDVNGVYDVDIYVANVSASASLDLFG